jgi:4-alpha-glucanotransferase
MLISPELLVADGLLDPADIAAPPVFPEEQVDFGPVIEHKMRLLERSYRNFKEQWAPPTRRSSSPFVNKRLSGSKTTSCFAP